MGKKCIVCNEEAVFKIKDSSEYYCGECAQENFGDVSLLIHVEDEARRLKEYISQKLEDEEQDKERNKDD